VTTVAKLLIESLADHRVTHIWGVVGDALNPVTDAIRQEDRITWMGPRHEDAGAFAAGAQAQLTGGLGGRRGTVGPGAIHLLNGLIGGAYLAGWLLDLEELARETCGGPVTHQTST
jgi:pyruvate dehydrogenase (quinone)